MEAYRNTVTIDDTNKTVTDSIIKVADNILEELRKLEERGYPNDSLVDKEMASRISASVHRIVEECLTEPKSDAWEDIMLATLEEYSNLLKELMQVEQMIPKLTVYTLSEEE